MFVKEFTCVAYRQHLDWLIDLITCLVQYNVQITKTACKVSLTMNSFQVIKSKLNILVAAYTKNYSIIIISDLQYCMSF